MRVKIIDAPGGNVAVVHSDSPVITDGQSAIEFALNVGERLIAVNKGAVSEDFFRLSTGVAGEVSQKFVNYGYRVAIIGDFSGYASEPLRDYIYECNNGGHLYFVDSEEAALKKLVGRR
ncbi:MAG: DUF4180 domain-containing protein [Clostridiales bacterium]|jgi:hypothetical protein|nr:DUF4180 domain-containing protein [Clostridiales bacterium]